MQNIIQEIICILSAISQRELGRRCSKKKKNVSLVERRLKLR